MVHPPLSDPRIEAFLQREVNNALRIGGLCAAGLGLAGSVGIVGFILATGETAYWGPCFAAVGAGLYSLVIWAAARAERLYGPLRYVVMLPFVSLPTVFFLACESIYPAGAATYITGPFSYLYLFVVAVTAFVFSPRLSLVAGATAAAQYFLIQIMAEDVLLQINAPDRLLYMDLTGRFIFFNKALMVIATGGAAAGSAWLGRRLLHRVLAEEREREFIGKLFGEYVSAEVKEHIVRQKGAVVGERCQVAVLFSDLRGFSTFSEGRDPAEVVQRLNAYFERMVHAIESEGGVVDKFIGDAVMAVFGGVLELSNPSSAAVRAARRMRHALAELNAEWAAQGIAPFDSGIGIHLGEVIQGPLGSSSRKEFTVIGDAVNTASRLESLTKEKQVTLLVTDAVHAQLPPDECHGFQAMGESTVKGKREVLVLHGALL